MQAGQQETHDLISSSVALQVSKVSAAAPPSCMCAVGPELIFLGSCAGDSLLLRALPEQQAKAEVWLLSSSADLVKQLQHHGSSFDSHLNDLPGVRQEHVSLLSL